MYRISYRFLVPGWSAKPLVSAHDRIMGTHRLSYSLIMSLMDYALDPGASPDQDISSHASEDTETK